MATWGVEQVGMTSAGMEYRVVKASSIPCLESWIAIRPKKRMCMWDCDLHVYLRNTANRKRIRLGGVVRVVDNIGRSTAKLNRHLPVQT